MKPNWKPATPTEVDEIEKACRDWFESDGDADSPNINTRNIMSLVLRIKELEQQLAVLR